MENQESIVIWALRNHKSLQLNLKKLNWVESWMPGWYDVEAGIYLNGQLWVGRGTADSADLAITKALSETFERHAAFSSGLPNSNGVAAHKSTRECNLIAAAELLERDAFLLHFYTGLPFRSISNFESHLPASLNSAHIKVREIGIKVQFFEARRCSQFFICGCYFLGTEVYDRPFGVVVGLGASLVKETAIQKAFLEGLRNVVSILDGEIKFLSIEEFRTESSPGPLEHRLVALNPNYPKLLPKISDQNWNLAPFNETDIEFRNLESPSPLAISQARSKSIQNMFFGTPNAKTLNLQRMEEFCKSSLDVERLDLPHPIG